MRILGEVLKWHSECQDCRGNCCLKFTINHSPEKIKQLYLEWRDQGVKNTDVYLIYPMLIYLGKEGTGDNVNYFYTCKHLTRRGECEIYDIRPEMCKVYLCESITQKKAKESAKVEAVKKGGEESGAEDLGTGKVALYVRKVGEPTEKDRTLIADNGPGENDPVKVLQRELRERSK